MPNLKVLRGDEELVNREFVVGTNLEQALGGIELGENEVPMLGDDVLLPGTVLESVEGADVVILLSADEEADDEPIEFVFVVEKGEDRNQTQFEDGRTVAEVGGALAAGEAYVVGNQYVAGDRVLTTDDAEEGGDIIVRIVADTRETAGDVVVVRGEEELLRQSLPAEGIAAQELLGAIPLTGKEAVWFRGAQVEPAQMLRLSDRLPGETDLTLIVSEDGEWGAGG